VVRRIAMAERTEPRAGVHQHASGIQFEAKEVGWNDRASSLLASVPDDKRLELYQHDHFRGRMLELGPGTHMVRDLKIHRLGDAITSVRWR
jgi:hypothetical protein